MTREKGGKLVEVLWCPRSQIKKRASKKRVESINTADASSKMRPEK